MCFSKKKKSSLNIHFGNQFYARCVSSFEFCETNGIKWKKKKMKSWQRPVCILRCVYCILRSFLLSFSCCCTIEASFNSFTHSIQPLRRFINAFRHKQLSFILFQCIAIECLYLGISPLISSMPFLCRKKAESVFQHHTSYFLEQFSVLCMGVSVCMCRQVIVS